MQGSLPRADAWPAEEGKVIPVHFKADIQTRLMLSGKAAKEEKEMGSNEMPPLAN